MKQLSRLGANAIVMVILIAGCASTPMSPSSSPMAGGVPTPSLPYDEYAPETNTPPPQNIPPNAETPPLYDQYSTEAPPPDAVYPDTPYLNQPFDSVYIDPPLEQPAPVSVDWAPPPLLNEEVTPQPTPDTVWTGGYWAWQNNWVWVRGRWSAPPRRGYHWMHPYYERRSDSVVFVDGFWAAPGVSFHRPSLNARIPLAHVGPGAVHGPRPFGPEGAFTPPRVARRNVVTPERPSQVLQPQIAPAIEAPASAPQAQSVVPLDQNQAQQRLQSQTPPAPVRQYPLPQVRRTRRAAAPALPQVQRDHAQERAQRMRAARAATNALQRASQLQIQPLRQPPSQPQMQLPHVQPQQRMPQYVAPRAAPAAAARPAAASPSAEGREGGGGRGRE